MILIISYICDILKDKLSCIKAQIVCQTSMICHVYGQYYAEIASEGIERKRDTVLRKHVVSLRWHAFMLWNIIKANEDKPSQVSQCIIFGDMTWA